MAGVLLSSVGSIVNIALQIKEAVKNVHQNEDLCRKIASSVDINSGILQILVEGTDVTQVEVMCHALEDVKTTFEDALKLVIKCQNRHIFCRFFWAKDIANDLKSVLSDIGIKMQQASLCGTVQEALVVTRIHCAVTAAPPPPPHSEDDIEVSTGGFTRFSLSLLKKATNNFSKENKIGAGGFSSVYKGVLHDGVEVAIKKFHKYLAHGNTACLAEFIVGTKLQHKNVVSLLGYCIDTRVSYCESNGRFAEAEDRKNFLVLEFVPNGSLKEIVAGTRQIDWSSCYKIILEIAQGVHYIHEQQVIHLDLNPSNILFNWDMTPVITDFGLSKVLEHCDDEIVLDEVLGTVGYMAPEQYSNRVVSLKSDVFVFGITLLRTIIREHAIIKCNTGSGGKEWERMLVEAGGLKGLLNPALKVSESQFPMVNWSVEVGLLCIALNPAERPSMADVVYMLSEMKKAPILKKPERVGAKKSRRALNENQPQVHRRGSA